MTKSKTSLFHGATGRNILLQGIVQTGLVMLSFCLGSYVLQGGAHHEVGMTMAFISLCFIQLFHSFNLKLQKGTLFTRSIFRNKLLNLSFFVGVALVLIPVLVPGLQTVFGTAPLNWKEWLVALSCAFAIVPIVEAQKAIERAIEKKRV